MFFGLSFALNVQLPLGISIPGLPGVAPQITSPTEVIVTNNGDGTYTYEIVPATFSGDPTPGIVISGTGSAFEFSPPSITLAEGAAPGSFITTGSNSRGSVSSEEAFTVPGVGAVAPSITTPGRVDYSDDGAGNYTLTLVEPIFAGTTPITVTQTGTGVVPQSPGSTVTGLQTGSVQTGTVVFRGTNSVDSASQTVDVSIPAFVNTGLSELSLLDLTRNNEKYDAGTALRLRPPNTYDVGVTTFAGLNTALNNATGGEVIAVLNDLTADPSVRLARNKTYTSEVVVQGYFDARISGQTVFENAKNLTWRNLRFTGFSLEGTTGSKILLQPLGACDNILIERCKFWGRSTDLQGNYKPSGSFGSWRAISTVAGASGSARKITVRECTFEGLEKGVKIDSVGGGVSVTYCYFHKMYSDPCAIAPQGDGLTAGITFSYNVCTDFLGKPINAGGVGQGDEDDPHSEPFQLLNATSADNQECTNIVIEGNVLWSGPAARGLGTQGINSFAGGNAVGTIMKDPIIRNNWISLDGNHHCTINAIDGGLFENNTLLDARPVTDGTTGFGARFNLGQRISRGTITIRNNMTARVPEIAGSATIVSEGNITDALVADVAAPTLDLRHWADVVTGAVGVGRALGKGAKVLGQQTFGVRPGLADGFYIKDAPVFLPPNIPVRVRNASVGGVVMARTVYPSGFRTAPQQIGTVGAGGSIDGMIWAPITKEYGTIQAYFRDAPGIGATTVQTCCAGLCMFWTEQSNGRAFVKASFTADQPGVVAGAIINPTGFEWQQIEDRSSEDFQTASLGVRKFITSGGSQSKPVAELASVFTRNFPEANAFMAADVVSGRSQVDTLQDGSPTPPAPDAGDRSWFRYNELHDSLKENGGFFGYQAILHPNGVSGSADQYSAWIGFVHLNRNLDGTVFSDGTRPVALPYAGLPTVDHLFEDAMPEGTTAYSVQHSGYGLSHSTYSGFGTLENAELDAAVIVQEAFPKLMKYGGMHRLQYLGKPFATTPATGETLDDRAHYTSDDPRGQEGVMERARSMMALMLQNIGWLDFEFPRIDEAAVAWTTSEIRLKEQYRRQITTRAMVEGLPALDGSIDPLLDGDVIGFARGAQDLVVGATVSGKDLVVPGSYDGADTMYLEAAGGGGTNGIDMLNYWNADGHAYRPRVDVGVKGWSGMQLQLPSTFEFINAANDLPLAPSGPNEHQFVDNHKFLLKTGTLPQTAEMAVEVIFRDNVGFTQTSIYRTASPSFFQNCNVNPNGSVQVKSRFVSPTGTFITFDKTTAAGVVNSTAANLKFRVELKPEQGRVNLFFNDTAFTDANFGVNNAVATGPGWTVNSQGTQFEALLRKEGFLTSFKLWSTATTTGVSPDAEVYADASGALLTRASGGAAVPVGAATAPFFQTFD